MSVELHVSNELLHALEPGHLDAALKQFAAEVVDTQPDDTGMYTIYTLDVPDAPPGAYRVVPVYQAHDNGLTVTPYLRHLNWYDIQGRLINLED